MSTNSIIQQLSDLGYFLDSFGGRSVEISLMKLHDQPVRDAIERYRLNMDSPETTLDELFSIDRCGCPDYAVEEAGRGSWPSNCHKDFPGVHSFAVYFDKSGMPSWWRDIFDAAWLLVRQSFADIGIAFFEVDSASRANTVVTWTRGSGWIGLAIVPNSPRCGQRIWAKFDTRYRPSDLLNQVARLLAHEFCHNMGLGHTRGGIMNPSITSGPFGPRAWRGDPAERDLVRFFGGVPVDLKIGGPGPTPEPEPNQYWFDGSFNLMQGDKSLGEFILTPKIKV